jgi:small-conductance mechanosensitive channel
MAINFLAQVPIGTVSTSAGNLGPLDLVIQMLQNFGFFRVILPFLLVFAIIYAVLVKTQVLGDSKVAKNSAAIVALVSAFLVIVYTPVVSAMATLLPQASFLIVIVVLLLMVLGLFGIKFGETGPFAKKPTTLYIIAAIVVFLFVVMVGYVIGPSVPLLYGLSQFFMGALPVTGEVSSETIALIVGIIIILGIVGGVIYMVTRSDKP